MGLYPHSPQRGQLWETMFYTVTATALALGDWTRGQGGTGMSWANEILTLWNTNSEIGNESKLILKTNM